MVKTKYIFASKLQFFMMVFSSLFVIGLLAYVSFVEGETLSVPVFVVSVGLMLILTWVTWESYQGRMPLLIIEEKNK